MPRPSEGWKLRDPDPPKSPNYTVRFRWNGRDYERSTGTRDPARAGKEAARIYASVVATASRTRSPTRKVGQLEGALTRWCESLLLDPESIERYARMGRTHWVPFFEDGIHNITAETIALYTKTRLGKVEAATVRKEHSGLRGFIEWASTPEQNLMAFVDIPGLPKKTVGTKFAVRRRAAAIPLSPVETKKILAALPEWSTAPNSPKHPIRARYEVQYETGLRPELIDRLSVPEHYRRKAKHIIITPELDKGRWARRVLLSPAARKALERVCPKDGIIFGHHRHDVVLRRAAKAALGKGRTDSQLFTGAHLRSARITHWVDDGAPLTGVQHQVGHLHLQTTARYVRPSERAGDSVILGAHRRAK